MRTWPSANTDKETSERGVRRSGCDIGAFLFMNERKLTQWKTERYESMNGFFDKPDEYQ